MDKVVILGNGPSMRGFDFMKLNGTATIGLNAAYRYWNKIEWWPTYYCCFDTQLIKTHHSEIRKLLLDGRVKKIFVRGNFFDFYPELKGNENIHLIESYINPKFARDAGATYIQNKYFQSSNNMRITTGGHAIRVGFMLGYKTVLLLGIDCRYIEMIPEAKVVRGYELIITKTPTHNPNYFFDEYQQEGDLYHVPNPRDNLHLKVFKMLKEDMERYSFDTKVINCNKDSALYDENIFPYYTLDAVL